MYDSIALNIIKYFKYKKDKLYLLVDEAYTDIARSIKTYHAETEIRIVQSYDAQNVENLFDLPLSAVVLFLAEPETYVKYKMFQMCELSK